MKIGILTFHRAHNYGAVLQCYALQEVLKSMGHDVWIIDYRQPYIEYLYTPFALNHLWSMRFRLKPILGYIRKTPQRYFRKHLFSNFQKQYFRTTEIYTSSISENFDIYVIGSDQIWGLHCTNGIDKIYFGEFEHRKDSKIVGYAISTNQNSLEQIGATSLKKYTNNFTSLSFREKKIATLVNEITGIQPKVVIDPTLLADSSLWNNLINLEWKNKTYVLVYQVRYPKKERELLKNKAKKIAQELNCEVIDISTGTYSLSTFVSLFKYASYVVTSSFHAIAFSLIFHRPFYAVKLNDGHDERYESLLNNLEANAMLVEKDFIPKVQTINFEPIQQKLNKLQKESINFLEKSFF
ncbi:polysaccharide pyruvyl transferase family protein [Phocaeicola sp.]